MPESLKLCYLINILLTPSELLFNTRAGNTNVGIRSTRPVLLIPMFRIVYVSHFTHPNNQVNNNNRGSSSGASEFIPHVVVTCLVSCCKYSFLLNRWALPNDSYSVYCASQEENGGTSRKRAWYIGRGCHCPWKNIS